MSSDLLDRMRRNPAGDWQIGDVEPFAANMVCCFGRAVERGIAMPNIRQPAKY